MDDRPVNDDAPLLADLMPWGVPPLRLGRSWVMAPDPRALRARWDALTAAGDGGAERAGGTGNAGDPAEAVAAGDPEGPGRFSRLFVPTRSRGPHRTVAQLPGHPAGTGPMAAERGRCPEPVPVLHGAFDQQWLIPDHRLIDAARPELWRVADERQVFLVEAGGLPGGAPGGPQGEPAVVAAAVLPDGRGPGRGGRIRPLYRRPGGGDANLAPGLADWLGERLGTGRPCPAADLAAWILAAARRAPDGVRVPLPGSAAVWREGVLLGRAVIEAQTRGARSGSRPRLPGGRRPYVRAALPDRPGGVDYDAAEETLLVAPEGRVAPDGRVAPVPAGAWELRVGGVRVLESWFAARGPAPESDALEAIGPRGWPREWTSGLLELVTVLALLADAAPAVRRLAERLSAEPGPGTAALRAAGVLPVPAAARRPASVLDHHEEGPGGQFTLV